MPESTAPTRTAPILIVEKAVACTTSRAVRGPVRSGVPGVTTWESTYAATAAAVSRNTVTSVGRRRRGTSRHRAGWLGQAHAIRRFHGVAPKLFSGDMRRPRVCDVVTVSPGRLRTLRATRIVRDGAQHPCGSPRGQGEFSDKT